MAYTHIGLSQDDLERDTLRAPLSDDMDSGAAQRVLALGRPSFPAAGWCVGASILCAVAGRSHLLEEKSMEHDKYVNLYNEGAQ